MISLETEPTIAVIGLGYVGLPLSVAFSKVGSVIGFDTNQIRIQELTRGRDATGEITDTDLRKATTLRLTDNLEKLRNADVYVITVPTPVDKHNRPDLSPLITASENVGSVLSKGNVVIYESTVYPGCTEEECVPVLERESGLKFNTDFFVGYSPERMNPGDKQHTVSSIVKVTSGSTPETAEFVDNLYRSIVTVGTHKASSIRVAEAAKVIENAQRDLNIAFVNELALLFGRLGIDTLEVLEAAGSKWNFLPFRPGLVGGHCIGVDPYYLAHKAQEVGYHPELILAGRRLNDNMGSYVAAQVVKLMIKQKHAVANARVLVLGITFKENCPDIRNSRVIDVIRELSDYGCEVHVHDPHADRAEVLSEYGVELRSPRSPYDCVVVAVAHSEFRQMDVRGLCKNDNGLVYDLKGILDPAIVDGRL